jgi:hypothetical protein
MSYDNFKQGSMYQGLQKNYAQQGQQAMKDTLGQVAARTGGMASSYATTAAQQSYNNYMQQLEDVARSMYNDEYARARDKVSLAQNEYDRLYGEKRDAILDKRYDDEQAYLRGRDKITDQRYLTDKEEERVASNAYYGNALSYADYKDAGGTLDEKSYNSIVATAQGKRKDDTYDITLADKQQAQNDVIAIWATGGTPTAEQLAAAGWADDSAPGSEDSTIPAGLSALGQAYYKQATAEPAEEEPEFRGVSASDFQTYSAMFTDKLTSDEAVLLSLQIAQATGNQDFADLLLEQWLAKYDNGSPAYVPIGDPGGRTPHLGTALR